MDKYIKEYTNKADWRVKENSNTVFSIGGLKNLLAETAVAKHALGSLPKEVENAHKHHLMHIHDLGNYLMPYCGGFSIKDILLGGLQVDARFPASAPAKHFGTALEHILNHCFIHTQEFSGAIAYSSTDVFLAPFIREDKLTYLEVKQLVQRLVFSLSQKYRTGLQSPFSNITIDLKPLGNLKDAHVIVGGKELAYTYSDCQPEIDMFNKAFCEVMSAGDSMGKPFSFPIPTYSMTREFDWYGETSKMLFDMAVKTGIPYFSNFLNSDMNPDDVRSMCPLDSSEDILVLDEKKKQFMRTNIKELYYNTQKDERSSIRKVLSHGKLINVTINQFPLSEYVEIELVNGHKIKTTLNHLNKTLRGDEIPSSELTLNDYLPISNKIYEGKGLSYEEGLLVGAFLGDGSYKDNNTVVYSLNRDSKGNLLNKIIAIAEEGYGAYVTTTELQSDLSGKYSCTNVNINSTYFRGLIEDFVPNKLALEKEINLKAINMSKEFRQGILDGLYATDGGNSNRIYTGSEALKNDLITLCASLGISTRVDKDNRTKEDGKLSDNIIYCIRFYSKNGHGLKDVYQKTEDFNWFKIKSITPYKKQNNAKAYCLEVQGNNEPFFMMPNGIHTHNCRLRLDKRELVNNGGGLFGSGENTGSLGVVTLNMPRLAFMAQNPTHHKVKLLIDNLDNTTLTKFLNAKSTQERFNIIIKYTMNLAKISLVHKRGIVEENFKRDLFPYTKVTLDDFSNHFNTIGLVGMHEALLNMNYNMGILSNEGKLLAEQTLDLMLEELKDYQEEFGEYYDYNSFKKGLLFNLEASPSEGAGYKLARYDAEYFGKKAKVSNGRTDVEPYYTNSTWVPQDDKININIFDVLDHQDSLQSKYTSGTVQHIYTEGELTWEKGRDIIKKACENYKMPYFSLSPTITVCPVHGRLNKEYEFCPHTHTDEELAYITKMGGIIVQVPKDGE